MVGFYSEDKLYVANLLLHDFVVTSVANDKVPRLITRKQPNKVKLDCEDIFTYFSLLDKENKEKITLPRYIAENLDRILTFRPSNVDVVCLRNVVQELKLFMSSFSEEVKYLRDHLSEPDSSRASVSNVASNFLWSDLQPVRVTFPSKNSAATDSSKVTSHGDTSASGVGNQP